MRFIILVRTTDERASGRAAADPRHDEEVSRYHGDLAKAGVLLDASTLHPSSEGWRLRWAGREEMLVDGPFAEMEGAVAGYTIIQVSSREEALEWTRRFPLADSCGLEVRQLRGE